MHPSLTRRVGDGSITTLTRRVSEGSYTASLTHRVGGCWITAPTRRARSIVHPRLRVGLLSQTRFWLRGFAAIEQQLMIESLQSFLFVRILFEILLHQAVATRRVADR